MQETLYYQDEAVRITNVTAEFGAKTYRIADIDSVRSVKQPDNRTRGIIALVLGFTGIGLGTVVLLNTTSNRVAWVAIIGGSLILIVLGAVIVARAKATYAVRLITSSGGFDALYSTDDDRIRHIVHAIQAATVGRDSETSA